MATPILCITDGSTTINLLGEALRVSPWVTGSFGLKGGGVVANPPLANGSAMQLYRYEDIQEGFTVEIVTGDDDVAAQAVGNLLRLLQKAVDYWVTPWSQEPVWIEARGRSESNKRHATIKSYQVSNLPDLLQVASLTVPGTQRFSFQLSLVHEVWREHAPGENDPVEMSGQQDYSGTTYGRAATESLEVFVANKHNDANITDAYTWTAGPVWGANMIGAALPVDLFAGGAAGPANGDITYFGIDTTGAPDDSGPFCSLAFSIETAATYGAGDFVTWQYYSQAAGPGWANLTVTSDTTSLSAAVVNQPFQDTGVGVIVFEQPTDWRTFAAAPAAAITGYWVRCVVTEATGITRARQGSRDIYTVVMGCVDVDRYRLAGTEQVDGDLPALLKLNAHAVSKMSAGGGSTSYVSAILVGLRSKDRGENFRAFLNFSEDGAGNTEQNPAGLSVSFQNNTAASVLPPAANYVTDGPAEYCGRYSSAGVHVMQDQVTLSFASGAPHLADEYRGLFRMFVRYRNTTGSDGDLLMTAELYRSTATVALPTYELNADNEWSIVDFGAVDLSWGLSRREEHDTSTGMGIIIQIQNTAAAARVCYLYDVVLVPADEWLARIESASLRQLLNKVYLQIDSTRASPTLDATLHSWASSPDVYERGIAYAAGPAILQTRRDQRLWFLCLNYDYTSNEFRYSHPVQTLMLQGWRTNRYQLTRGTR